MAPRDAGRNRGTIPGNRLNPIGSNADEFFVEWNGDMHARRSDGNGGPPGRWIVRQGTMIRGSRTDRTPAYRLRHCSPSISKPGCRLNKPAPKLNRSGPITTASEALPRPPVNRLVQSHPSHH